MAGLYLQRFQFNCFGLQSGHRDFNAPGNILRSTAFGTSYPHLSPNPDAARIYARSVNPGPLSAAPHLASATGGGMDWDPTCASAVRCPLSPLVRIRVSVLRL